MFSSWLLPALIASFGWTVDISNAQTLTLGDCTATNTGSNLCRVDIGSPVEVFPISGPLVGATFMLGTESYLFADCPSTSSFSTNCDCVIVIGDLSEPDYCNSCDFIVVVPSLSIQIAFDCSNLLDGPCVGATPEGACIGDEPTTPTPPTAPTVPSPDAPVSGSIGLPFYDKNGGWMILMFLASFLG